MIEQLLASMAAIVILTAIAWRMGFSVQPRLDADLAREQAAAGLPGFRPSDVLMATDGRSALVRSQEGAIALVLGLGDGWVVRSVDADAVSVRAGGALHVVLGEPNLRQLEFAPDGPVPDWLALTA